MDDSKEYDEDNPCERMEIEKISKNITNHVKFSMFELNGKNKRNKN